MCSATYSTCIYVSMCVCVCVCVFVCVCVCVTSTLDMTVFDLSVSIQDRWPSLNPAVLFR